MRLLPYLDEGIEQLDKSLLLALTVFLLVVLLAVLRSYAAKNYLGHNEPFYSGNFAIGKPKPSEELTVVTYNIWYGEKLDQAITEIKELESQGTLDILLLQEMDETGAERVARELQLNYVYYPAAVEPKYHRNFGNAVLSRWPIVDAQKILLPHISLSDRMKRVATRATIRIRDEDIVAYSLHTEPVFILPKFKDEQCWAVLDDMGAACKVIVGGDFNSFTKAYIEKIEKRYEQAGFVRASKDSGFTMVRFGIRMSTDQIFAKGFDVKAMGKLAGAKASDHLPVWATLTPRNGYKVNDDSN